jgi:hypothetical protein
MAHVDKANQANPEAADKAFRMNWISAVVMTLAMAAVLLVQRPEVAWVFVSYVTLSVLVISFVRSRGILNIPIKARLVIIGCCSSSCCRS